MASLSLCLLPTLSYRTCIYVCVHVHTADEQIALKALPKKMKADLAIHVHLDTLSKVTLFQVRTYVCTYVHVCVYVHTYCAHMCTHTHSAQCTPLTPAPTQDCEKTLL